MSIMKNTEYYKSGQLTANGIKNLRKATYTKILCQYCSKDIGKPNVKRHEKSCYLNPKNLKLCPECNDPIKNYRINTTCSYSCSNKHFNGVVRNLNITRYRTICFRHHEKKCAICDEKNIVEVHHDPDNLIPLCSTHHKYMHSRFKDLIIDQVDQYRKNRLTKK